MKHSPAWQFFSWASFACAAILMSVGIYNLPVDVWIRGYLAMGSFFLVGSAFTLAKTLRDQFEQTLSEPRVETEARKSGLTVSLS